MKMSLLALVAISLAAPATAQRSTAPRIGQIRAQLYYEETGRLSGNIAPPTDFHAWNTIIGEGSAEEQARDILISVEVLGRGGQENIALPLDIVARGRGGRVLARRRIANMLTSNQGRVWSTLWLNDATCDGAIDIVATIGRSSARTQLGMDCGE
jgi:hypothetical protein